MKTHAVKENRILKSIDSVIIVLTMSFVTFMILKSTVYFADFRNHSGSGASLKVEFPASQQNGIPAYNENTVQGSSTVIADPAGNAMNDIKSEKGKTQSVSMKSNAVTAVKGVIQSKAANVDQSLKTNAERKNTENAPLIDSRNEKSILENWVKSRDDWEQK